MCTNSNQKMVFAQNDPFDRWMKQNLRGEGQKDVHGDWKPRPYHWVKVDVVWDSYQKYIKDNGFYLNQNIVSAADMRAYQVRRLPPSRRDVPCLLCPNDL